MKDSIDTSPKYQNDLPDGKREFMIIGGIEKFYSPCEFYVLKLQHKDGVGEQAMFPNMMRPLLRALGCEETGPNKFSWDTEEQAGKRFIANISHKPDKKDASKIRQHMSEIEKVKSEEPIEF